MSDNLQKGFDEFTRQIERETRLALARCGAHVEREAKQSMKQGGKMKGPMGGNRRVPSMQLTPPNVQTGTLRSSIAYALTSVMTAVVGPTRVAWYGKIHEKGGEFGGRHYPARPFMAPALMRCLEKFKEEFQRFDLRNQK